MSGEGVVVGVALNRAARGEPLRIDMTTPRGDERNWVEQRFDSGLTAPSERAKVVAYLHGLADTQVRREEMFGEDRGSNTIRRAAQAIANGEHWQ